MKKRKKNSRGRGGRLNKYKTSPSLQGSLLFSSGLQTAWSALPRWSRNRQKILPWLREKPNSVALQELWITIRIPIRPNQLGPHPRQRPPPCPRSPVLSLGELKLFSSCIAVTLPISSLHMARCEIQIWRVGVCHIASLAPQPQSSRFFGTTPVCSIFHVRSMGDGGRLYGRGVVLVLQSLKPLPMCPS